MAKPKKRNKRKGKIKIRKSVRLVHKNDATRVDKQQFVPKAEAKVYPENGASFKIKIRKK